MNLLTKQEIETLLNKIAEIKAAALASAAGGAK